MSRRPTLEKPPGEAAMRGPQAFERLASGRQTLDAAPPLLARRAVEAFVIEGCVIEVPSDVPPPLIGTAGACFVCIKTDGKKLRGCIGTVEPTQKSLAEEIVANAVSAATRDPRFPAVSAAELPRLRYCVDVLERPEPARFEDLNPKDFGIIVEDNTGGRRGLLLPDIDGIETAQRQVQTAARKAGILPHEPLRLYRFRVRRFVEVA